MERRDKENYYLDIAETVAERGTCLRRNFGAIFVNRERYELCRSVHAEANAIIHASRNDTLGGTLYLVGKNAADNSYVENAAPCSMCKRMIINAGIVRVIIRNTKDSFTSVNVDDWIYNDESLTGTRGY